MTTPRTRWETETVGPRWTAYRQRFERLQAEGADLGGEARFVDVLVARNARILDAGCGVGRVTAALQASGHRVTGIDRDAGLVEAAVRWYPDVDYRVCDLLDAGSLGERFDAIVLAGNVLVYMAPGTERAGLAGLADLLVPGGRMAAGFATDRAYTVANLDTDANAVGLVIESRFATWHLDPWRDDSDWAVTVLRKP